MDWGRFQRSCVNIQQMHIPVSGNSCWLSDDLYNLFRLMISFARTGGQDNIYKSEVVLILPVLRTRPGLQNPPLFCMRTPREFQVPIGVWTGMSPLGSNCEFQTARVGIGRIGRDCRIRGYAHLGQMSGDRGWVNVCGCDAASPPVSLLLAHYWLPKVCVKYSGNWKNQENQYRHSQKI